MEFKRSIIINRPPAEVWEVLGTQFGDACQWASGLEHSEGYGTPTIAGATVSNRTCKTSVGNVKEEILHFDPQKYELMYRVIEGFPFFIDDGVNHWQLHQEDANATRVDMHLVIVTKGLVGMLMGPVMKRQMSQIADDVVDDLKQYVETGQPSARKAKELAKQLAKAA